MGYSFTRANSKRTLSKDPNMTSDNGMITTDATAQASNALTAAAGAWNTAVTMISTAGFISQDAIQIPGGGASGANFFTFLRAVIAENTTNVRFPQQGALLTGVSGAVVTAYYRIFTEWQPRVVKLLNLTTGERFEWHREMLPNTAIKTDVNGTVTVLTENGIASTAIGFYFSPTMLGTNSKMIYEVSF